MIIIKGISVVPIYHTWWKPKVLYNNTDNTHTKMQLHTNLWMGDTQIDTAVEKKVVQKALVNG